MPEHDGDTENKSKKSTKRKIAGWSAIGLWLLSIAMSFAIAPSSNLIWLPDALLLIGFFPLIWLCPYSILWITFGLFTAAIGFILLVLTNIPDSALPAQTWAIKKHLAEYHPAWSWLIIGTVATIYGTIRFLINSTLFIIRKARSKKSESPKE
jgi:hypothetical protein